MKKSSLQNELHRLKNYLKELNVKRRLTKIELTMHSYTIAGMIEHIYSLISTGAYTPADDSLDELFDIIETVRNTAVHYNKSADFHVMEEHAQRIINATPEEFSQTIIEKIKKTTSTTSYPDCLLVANSAEIKIKDGDYIVGDSILFENIRTKEKLYIPKKHVYILENKTTGSVSYLVRFSSEVDCFYKAGENPTIKVSNAKMYAEHFFVPGYINGVEKIVDIDKSINKIISKIIQDPYKLQLVIHSNGRNSYQFNAHNLIDDFLRYHQIDENIALGKFSVKEQTINASTDHIIKRLPHGFDRVMLEKASLRDILFIETFLKDVNAYREKLQEAEEENVEVSNFAKHSLLLEIFTRQGVGTEITE